MHIIDVESNHIEVELPAHRPKQRSGREMGEMNFPVALKWTEWMGPPRVEACKGQRPAFVGYRNYQNSARIQHYLDLFENLAR